jgi:hypothetical protein
MSSKYQKNPNQTSQTARNNSSQSSSHLSPGQLHLSKQQPKEPILPQSKQVDMSSTRLERKEQVKSMHFMITSWLTADVNEKQEK